MNQYISGNLSFYILGVLACIEQIFYYFPGSYVYQKGIKVNEIMVGKSEEMKFEIPKYFRIVYPFCGGPQIFIGQMCENRKVIIRSGWFTTVFVLYLVFSPLFKSGKFNGYDMFSSIFIVVFVIFIFERLKKTIASSLKF